MIGQLPAKYQIRIHRYDRAEFNYMQASLEGEKARDLELFLPSGCPNSRDSTVAKLNENDSTTYGLKKIH